MVRWSVRINRFGPPCSTCLFTRQSEPVQNRYTTTLRRGPRYSKHEFQLGDRVFISPCWYRYRRIVRDLALNPANPAAGFEDATTARIGYFDGLIFAACDWASSRIWASTFDGCSSWRPCPFARRSAILHPRLVVVLAPLFSCYRSVKKVNVFIIHLRSKYKEYNLGLRNGNDNPMSLVVDKEVVPIFLMDRGTQHFQKLELLQDNNALMLFNKSVADFQKRTIKTKTFISSDSSRTT
jgi:hypothetical protein